jgi:hypothetical protein
MKPRDLTFALALAYLKDSSPLLEPTEYERLIGYIRSRNVPRLASLCDESQYAYQSIELCRFYRQMAAFFKKNLSLVNSQENADEALLQFFRIERECAVVNRRIDRLWFDDKSIRSYFRKKYGIKGFDPIEALYRCQRFIENTLGDIEEFGQRFPAFLRVTAGATSHSSRRNSHPQNKMRIRNVPCPIMARPFVNSFYEYIGMPKPSFKKGSGWNRVITVPKNWKTDRTIACEPVAVLPLQLAFDKFVKSKLKKFGIDLSDQSRNQDLAYKGSISNELATIDLAAASDSLSYSTVEMLLPEKWFKYVAAVRSPFGKIGDTRSIYHTDRIFSYEKFSSMGNGTTFPLETLIFASACFATGHWNQFRDGSSHVYGDDIIVKSDQYPRVVALLDFLGFKVNHEKSFVDGPFRESCGKDYYLGCDVTPVYVRFQNPWKMELCHLVNTLSSVARPGGALWKYLADLVCEHNLPLVPYSLDTVRGVNIDTHSAYALGKVRTKQHVTSVKGYSLANGRKSYPKSDGLAYWYLQALSDKEKTRVVTSIEIETIIDSFDHNDLGCRTGSWVSTPSRRVVRRWFSWIPPTSVAPVHLYGWSDYLVAVMATKVG